MKIALITEYTAIGGGESNLLLLAQRLSVENEVTIFCSGKIKSEAEKRGLKTSFFKTPKKWISCFPIIRNGKCLIEELNRFDIIHSYSINCIPWLSRVKPEVVLTTHGYWEGFKGLRGKIIDRIVDKVICVSNDVFNITESKKKKVIFLGTALDCLEEDKIMGELSQVIKVLCVGRFQEIKGQGILLNAIQILSEKNKELKIELTFVGGVNSEDSKDIRYKEEVCLKAKELENNAIKINFKGFQSNVAYYYKNTDVVVIPSKYESFSMVAVEALAQGKPIVAPNVGGPKDIVSNEGIGLLFEPSNANDLALKINKCIENYSNFKTSELINRAKFFSVERQTNNHLTLYRSLLSE